MINLKPTAGLCNRMRAIDAALAMARAIDTQLQIYWVRGKDLNCPFGLLFEPFDDPRVTIHDRRFRPLKFILVHRRLHGLRQLIGMNQFTFATRDNERLRALDLSRIAPDDTLTIESFDRFYRTTRGYPDFQPVKSLADRIAERTAQFDGHVIGVHVRRADHTRSIIMSPDELFIEQMQREVEAQPMTRFYLATDSMEVKSNFIRAFGERIITTPYEAQRTSIAGVQEALIELYALSRTSKILGSYWSSYSETAAEIGHIKLIRIKRKDIMTNPSASL